MCHHLPGPALPAQVTHGLGTILVCNLCLLEGRCHECTQAATAEPLPCSQPAMCGGTTNETEKQRSLTHLRLLIYLASG